MQILQEENEYNLCTASASQNQLIFNSSAREFIVQFLQLITWFVKYSHPLLNSMCGFKPTRHLPFFLFALLENSFMQVLQKSF